MIINRQLRITLLISFLWHLFWLSCVTIIFLPSGLKPRQYSSVHFLGSILSNSVAHVERPKQLPGKVKTEVPEVEFPSEALVGKISHFKQSPHPTLAVEKEILSPDDIIDVDAPKEIAPSLLSFASTEKASAQREVIFQPPFPEYPEWLGNQEFRASSAVFKIYISSQGLVQEIVNVQASGNPEIDVVLARYVKRWRFAPAQPQEGHWQTVKINLDPK